MYPTIIYGLYSRKQGRCRITVAAALLERLARSAATEAELVAQWVLRQAAPRLALCAAAAATAKESKTYSVQCCNNAQQRIVASCWNVQCCCASEAALHSPYLKV